MVMYPDVQILDVTGPLEVFARTARWLVDHDRCGQPAYTVELLAAHPGIVRSSSGLELVVRRSFTDERRGIDTLLVAGGTGARRVIACCSGGFAGSLLACAASLRCVRAPSC
jgi:transcriptional regulator GlxA family with amidase domain